LIDGAAVRKPLTGGRAIGWSIAFLLLGFALTILFYSLFSVLRFGSVGGGTTGPNATGVAYIVAAGWSQLLGFGLATWIIGVRVLGLGAADLRWRGHGRGGRGFAVGLALGGIAALAALLLAVPAGGGWTADRGGAGDYLARVGITAAALAGPALSEEVAFRGVPLVLLALVFGRWPALVALALLFAVAHAVNPNATVFGLANIALAGILLGVAFFAPGGIWTAFGAHLGWNAALAAADAPVSGMPFSIPFIDHHPGAPAWLTGGAFGPEGGLTATVALAAATLVVARWARKGATA
jgi:membrane protease YdiL (CAAX protease family)